jgi:drug/metabolite transporter (DMT)-like permease
VRRQTADLLLLVTVTMWALNFTASKYLITHGFSPLAYAVPRYLLAGAIFVGLTLLLERSLRVGRRDLAVLALAAGVLFLNQLGYIYALHFSTATTVALLFGTLPIFTGLMAAATGVERPDRQFVAASAVSFAGVALVALGSGGSLSANLKGDALALLGVATWAAYSVMVAPLMVRNSPYRISAFVLTAAGVLLAFAGAPQVAHEAWPSSFTVWGLFGFAVLGPLVITTVLWFTAIERIGPSRASVFANLQFFLAAVFAVLLLSESISLVQVAGGALIGGAILLSRAGAVPAPQPVE